MLTNPISSLFEGFRPALRAIALAAVILLLGGALSAAKSPVPAAGDAPVLDWSFEQRLSESPSASTRPHARGDAWRHHVWIARIASIEMRMEWRSEHGRDTWSVTIEDAEAGAGTRQCI